MCGRSITYRTSGLLDTAVLLFFFQAEDGIRDLVRSRGLGDVYKRQVHRAEVAQALSMVVPRRGRLPRKSHEPDRRRHHRLSLIHI